MIRRRSLAALLTVVLGCFATTGRAGSLLYGSNYTTPYSIVTYDTTVTNPPPTTFASTGFFPTGVAFDSAGNLYVANYYGNAIEKFTPGGVGSVFASTGLDGPEALAFDSAGNLYVANYYSSTIEKFNPGGVGSSFASGLSGPIGLAFDSAGNLYVSNYYSNAIEKFTPGGIGSTFFTTSGPNGNYGLAFDAMGNLYVGNFYNSLIEKITPGGVGSVFATTGAYDAGALAFDAAGNLFVAGATVVSPNSLIEEFTPSGIGSVFVTNAPASFLAFAPSAVLEPSSVVLGSLALVSLGVFACARRRLRRGAAVGKAAAGIGRVVRGPLVSDTLN